MGVKFNLPEKDISIIWEGKETIFRVRTLKADDYWKIQDQCIDKNTEKFALDTHMINLMNLSKWIVDPPMKVEDIAELPEPISQRLADEFNLMHNKDQTRFLEEQKKVKKKE